MRHNSYLSFKLPTKIDLNVYKNNPNRPNPVTAGWDGFIILVYVVSCVSSTHTTPIFVFLVISEPNAFVKYILSYLSKMGSNEISYDIKKPLRAQYRVYFKERLRGFVATGPSLANYNCIHLFVSGSSGEWIVMIVTSERSKLQTKYITFVVPFGSLEV